MPSTSKKFIQRTLKKSIFFKSLLNRVFPPTKYVDRLANVETASSSYRVADTVAPCYEKGI